MNYGVLLIVSLVLHVPLTACCPLSWLFLLMWLLIKFERYPMNETLFFTEVQQPETLLVDVQSFCSNYIKAL